MGEARRRGTYEQRVAMAQGKMLFKAQSQFIDGQWIDPASPAVIEIMNSDLTPRQIAARKGAATRARKRLQAEAMPGELSA